MINSYIVKIIKNDAQFFSAFLFAGAVPMEQPTLIDTICKGLGTVSLYEKFALNESLHDSLPFINKHLPPVLLDEIQYAPHIFFDMEI